MNELAVSFNKIYLTGKEQQFIQEALQTGKIGSRGVFSDWCTHFMEQRYGFKKCLLTTSCTSAMEMAAILMNIQAGDEVILPSYTFVSTANAFLLRGAKLVFADSEAKNPNIDANRIEALITPRTKAIVVMHYAGIACDMEKISAICEKHHLLLLEDAAQCIDAYYTYSDGRKRALGSFGHFAAFSFHETKNIIAGEGGMLVVNDDCFIERAEIIYEKGTNRSQFLQQKVDKYEWKDIGSSFALSELNAAFLKAQLACIDEIQQKRNKAWSYYVHLFEKNNIMGLSLPDIPAYSVGNGHIFYLICENYTIRENLLNHSKKQGVQLAFHFSSLANSPYFKELSHGSTNETPVAECFARCLVRLPLYNSLTENQQVRVFESITSFFIH